MARRARGHRPVHGKERADFLRRLLKRARQLGRPAASCSRATSTRSRRQSPGSRATKRSRTASVPHHPLERRGHGRRRQQPLRGLGGHLSTYASAASLYEVGFNHFFRGKDDGSSATWCSSGPRGAGRLLARVLEGRISEAQNEPLPPRRPAACRPAELSAPAAHPRLLGVPDRSAWASGPLNAIYRARYNRYLNSARSRGRRTRACGRSSATARRTNRRRPAR